MNTVVDVAQLDAYRYPTIIGRIGQFSPYQATTIYIPDLTLSICKTVRLFASDINAIQFSAEIISPQDVPSSTQDEKSAKKIQMPKGVAEKIMALVKTLDNPNISQEQANIQKDTVAEIIQTANLFV